MAVYAAFWMRSVLVHVQIPTTMNCSRCRHRRRVVMNSLGTLAPSGPTIRTWTSRMRHAVRIRALASAFVSQSLRGLLFGGIQTLISSISWQSTA